MSPTCVFSPDKNAKATKSKHLTDLFYILCSHFDEKVAILVIFHGKSQFSWSGMLYDTPSRNHIIFSILVLDKQDTLKIKLKNNKKQLHRNLLRKSLPCSTVDGVLLDVTFPLPGVLLDVTFLFRVACCLLDVAFPYVLSCLSVSSFFVYDVKQEKR